MPPKDPIEQINSNIAQLNVSVTEVLTILRDQPQYQIDGLVSTVKKQGEAVRILPELKEKVDRHDEDITKLKTAKTIREAKIGVISGLGGGSLVAALFKLATMLGIKLF
jgi:alcohol dehydrogenase class IV